jgi:hypothetical protein
MKRLAVERNETVTELIERVITDAEAKLVLVVPRHSALKTSADSFALLAREAAGAGKTVVIESLDDEVLELAAAERLAVLHPAVLPRDGKRAMSDIIPVVKRPEKKEEKKSVRRGAEGAAERTVPVKKVVMLTPVAEAETHTKPSTSVAPSGRLGRNNELPALLRKPQKPLEDLPELNRRRSLSRGVRIAIGLIVIGGIVIGGAWTAAARFGSASVTITFRTAPWQYESTVTASTAANSIDADRGVIPSEVFHESSNLVQRFPATGTSTVPQRATGVLTISNAYSSASQLLVAATRFQTADGKIFRLDKQITVPGAKVSGKTITPSTVTASATADKPDETYNLASSTAKLTIPGFAGKPQFAGFWGSFLAGTSGGGAHAVVTDADAAAAQKKMSDILKARLENTILAAYSHDFKILDGASAVTITKLNVTKAVDADGNFNVFSEAQSQAFGFKESDLRSLLLSVATKDNAGLGFRDLQLTYTNVKPDFSHSTLSFTIAAQGTLAPPFSADDFKTSILGKSVNQARSLLTAVPGITDAKLSLWPFWLQGIPTDPKRVTITVK